MISSAPNPVQKKDQHPIQKPSEVPNFAPPSPTSHHRLLLAGATTPPSQRRPPPPSLLSLPALVIAGSGGAGRLASSPAAPTDSVSVGSGDEGCPHHHLCSSCYTESQREAALLLGQFAATDSDCKVHIVQRGAVKPLIDMLQSSDVQLKEMSAFALGRLAQANKQGGNTLSTRKPFSPLAERDNIVGKQCILYGWARRLIKHGLIQSADPNLVVHGKAAGSGNLKIALTEVVDPTCQLWLSDDFHDNIGKVGVGGFVVWPEHSVEVMNG